MSDAAFWPFGPEGLEDPYPHYAAQRASARLLTAETTTIATGYAEVRALLSDARSRAARVPPAEELGGGDERRGTPLRRTLERMAPLSDSPRHERVRRPVQRAFAPHVVAPWRERIAALAREHVDRADRARDADGIVDAVTLFAVPLFGDVIDEMLGLEPGAGEALRRDWRYAASSVDDREHGLAPDAPLRLLDVHERLTLALKRARAVPGDSPIDVLVRTAAEDPDLGDHDLVPNLIFILSSAHRAASQGLALAVHTLARHPAEWERLRREPALVPGAVEELLRWDAPVQLTSRVLSDDVDVDGCTLPAGQLLVLLLGAANHDPCAFAAGDRLDLGARAAGHVSFGYGPHFCAGAALSRIVLREALAALLERAPSLSLAGEPEWTTERRGFTRLPVRW